MVPIFMHGFLIKTELEQKTQAIPKKGRSPGHVYAECFTVILKFQRALGGTVYRTFSI